MADTGRGTPAAPVMFVLPDDVWDTRRARPYLEHLSLSGAAVVELWFDEDRRPGLAEARTAVASAVQEFNLDPSRVALLGFGTGGRLALSLAGPDRPAAALYPACQGAPVPAADARVVVLPRTRPPKRRPAPPWWPTPPPGARIALRRGRATPGTR